MTAIPEDRSQAISQEVFNSARRRAFVQDVLAELSGRSDNLLSFDDVREQLHLTVPAQGANLQEIPLDKIVGSVGRYRDFTRAFLPRAQIDPDRWMRIEQLRGKAGLPPIDVFQVGEVYFVRDGNHRVSVARSREHRTILARVVQIPVRVPLESDTSPDDLILKSEYAEFLESTSLDHLVPDLNIALTRPGGYLSLLQHIEVHQFYIGLRSHHYPTLSEASEDWYHKVYLPVVRRIQTSGILDHFPGRTEADLYLWIAENHARLQMRYKEHEESQEAEDAVDEFAERYRVAPLRRWLWTLLHRIFPRVLPPEPEKRRLPAASASKTAEPRRTIKGDR